MEKPVEIPVSEVVRYLGYRKEEPDAAVYEKIDRACALLKEHAQPRTTYKRLSAIVWDEANLQIGPMEVESRDLAKNMKDCREAFLIAATLGPEPDRLVRRAQLTDSAMAAVLQAAGAAMIEEVVDKLEQELCNMILKESEKTPYETEKLRLRPRFSPGYGDFSLEHQEDFMQILDMPKTIGVTLTDTLLMVPTKSVTAVIGLSPQKVVTAHDCAHCMAAGCPFRREV